MGFFYCFGLRCIFSFHLLLIRYQVVDVIYSALLITFQFDPSIFIYYRRETCLQV